MSYPDKDKSSFMAVVRCLIKSNWLSKEKSPSKNIGDHYKPPLAAEAVHVQMKTPKTNDMSF